MDGQEDCIRRHAGRWEIVAYRLCECSFLKRVSCMAARSKGLAAQSHDTRLAQRKSKQLRDPHCHAQRWRLQHQCAGSICRILTSCSPAAQKRHPCGPLPRTPPSSTSRPLWMPPQEQASLQAPGDTAHGPASASPEVAFRGFPAPAVQGHGRAYCWNAPMCDAMHPHCLYKGCLPHLQGARVCQFPQQSRRAQKT